MGKTKSLVKLDKFMLVDKETGEVVADNVLLIGKRGYIDKGFVKFFVAFLKDIIEDPELFGKAGKLLLYIAEQLDYNRLTVYLSAQKVCEDLGISRATYYLWLNTLLRKGYLTKIATNLYQLKPYTVIKGSMDKVEDVDTDF